MINFYEILVIASPDETDEGIDAIIGGLRQQLAVSGGEVIDINRWGRRKLAYPIGKHTEGVYLLIYATGPQTLTGEFRGYTKIRESILREMAVRLTDAEVTAAQEVLAERGPEDEALAKAQIEAADQRAAAKRAEAETSVSDRDEATESDDGIVATGDEAAIAANTEVVAAEDDAALAAEAVAIDEDPASVDEAEVVAAEDDAAPAAEAVAIDEDSASDDSDEESAGESPPAADSSDGVAESEPLKED